MSYLRNKTVFFFIFLLLLGALIGTLHNNAQEAGRPFLIQDAVRFALAPLDIACHAVVSVAGQAKGIFRPRYLILRENAALKKQVRQLMLENSKLKEAAEENIRLREALGLKKSTSYNMIAATVISRNESNWFDTATLDRGRQSGVNEGDAVINHLGLAGQVFEANYSTSQIVALTDSNSAVGGMVQRSRSSGIVQGQGTDYLVLTYLPKDADVIKNDIIVSSGMGGVIPKGIPIGRVVSVIRDSVAGTTSALIRPSVKFDQIEYVFILTQNGASKK